MHKLIKKHASFILVFALVISACTDKNPEKQAASKSKNTLTSQQLGERQHLAATVENSRFSIYTPVTLTSDLSHLSANQKQMLSLLIDASKIMDALFWKQSWGDKHGLLDSIENKNARRFVELNYGPWDRLDGNKSFLSSIEAKALGANFYPHDMSKAEFEAWDMPEKSGLYSIVTRNAKGDLQLTPYSEVFSEELEAASNLLIQAAELADNEAFANYLRLRADALITDQYRVSDMAWMDMKDNPIDLVIGPIENYEDQLYAYKSAFSSYVLIKDQGWSDRLARFAAFLPALQQGLPVEDKYKAEMPGSDSDLNAYDVIFYAGDSNAGAKTIAINLPNDERVQATKGTRRLQLKNAMKAKFDEILVPISEKLISAEQRQHITFDAFFANTMFHEVAHGLGIQTTITDGATVRQALKEAYSALEEGKADILGLYMVTKLFEQGEIKEGVLMDNYVTFMASIFRSIRFGAASAHGKANMMRFNFFQEKGAFTRNTEGLYQIDFKKMQSAMTELSQIILKLQGDGDYDGALALLNSHGKVGKALQADLDSLAAAGIPVDIEFIQGKAELGLD